MVYKLLNEEPSKICKNVATGTVSKRFIQANFYKIIKRKVHTSFKSKVQGAALAYMQLLSVFA